MEQKELVLLKNSPDRLLLIMAEEADFSEILEYTKAKIVKNGSFFKGVSMKLKYTGRTLTEAQEQEIISLFVQIGGMDVIDIGPEITVPQRPEGNLFRGIAYGLFEQPSDGKPVRPVRKANGIVQVAEGLTAYYYGNLKKGQKIVYKGSVVIFGNVESGAEVTVTENLMVFGKVKGNISIGGKHLKTAALVCEEFAASFFEIAQIQRTEASFEEKRKEITKRKLFQKQRPEMKLLRLSDNRITIAPLSGL